MKKFILFFLSWLFYHAVFSQVGVNTNGSAPHASAMLDVSSHNKGVLLPRVHLTGLFDTVTIPSPALSLLVYNTNPALEGGKGFYAWNGSVWNLLMSSGNSYIRGKNRFLTIVDGDTREYYVHVPESYDGTTNVPVVFMLHGTSGDGEKFYNISGWTEVSEEENIIAVFPSSWRYCIVDGGVQKNTTKWNTFPDADWTFCAGTTGRDDVKFLRTIINELRAKFAVDTTRIYLAGFSNGGQMAAKCAIDMSDVLAAVVENSAGFYIDTLYTPKRKLPVMFQVGNADWGAGTIAPEVPLSQFNLILDSTHPVAVVNARFNKPLQRHVKNFLLDTNYTIIGDTNKVVTAIFNGLSGHPLNKFFYVLVDGLRHAYPNGENHWMEAARLHWAWMKLYVLP